MGFLRWLSGNWFELLQTASILAAAFAIRADALERKVSNLFAVTAAHRELWTHFYQQPALHRILDSNPDLRAHPPTLPERRFVHELILHLRTSFRASGAGMEFDDEAVAADIRQFFARPIPRAVWEESKQFQSADFVAFVEAAIAAGRHASI